MANYSPVMDNLYVHKMLLRIQQEPSYANVFRNDLTNAFVKDMRNVANPDYQWTQNTIMSMSGETGTGKSIVMMSIGVNIFKNFTHENMFFFDQQILDNADKFPKNSFLVRDENTQKGVYGLGSTRASSQFGVMAETCRKYGMNLGLVEPSFMQTGITKIYLETVDFDIKRRLTRCALRDAKTLKYMGGVYIPVIPEDHPEWVAYNKKKDDFIESVRQGKMEGAKMDYDNVVDQIYEEIDTEIYRSKKERKAFIMRKYPVMTSGEIDMISTLLEVEIRENG